MPKPRLDPTTAIGYIRLSPGERKHSSDEEAAGIGAQRHAIESWCRTNGVTIAAWYQDLDTHGDAADPLDDPMRDRGQLNAAIDAIRDLGAGLIVVHKHDRLARDTTLSAMLTAMIERKGARICAADGTGNGESAEAHMMRGMVRLFAEYELHIIRARTRAALQVKKAAGRRTGSVPYGKRLASAAQGEKRLVDDPAEQAVIAQCRVLNVSGMGLASIARALTAAGIVTRTGRPFGATQVARILGMRYV